MRNLEKILVLKVFLCVTIGAMLLLFAGCSRSGPANRGPAGDAAPAARGAPAPQDAALGDGLFARITTSRGDIVVSLEYQRTPLTVCNFVALAEGTMTAAGGRPFYDGLTFHRVISRANGDAQDFMIQAGCPLGTGTGGPGYRFPDEFDPGLRHDRPGILSMANAGPGTNGSQFFITIVPTPHLDGRHTVFGHVVQGQNVVNTIRQGDRIETVRIIRNGASANAFRADQATFDTLLRAAESAAAARVRVQREADIAEINRQFPNAQITPSGIRYVINRQGTGGRPSPGSTVSLNYRGLLLSGHVFDNSDIAGRPLEFSVGTRQVIPGVDQSVLDMQLGERRTVIIPPELAYGEREIAGIIPANSFLIFELELIGIR